MCELKVFCCQGDVNSPYFALKHYSSLFVCFGTVHLFVCFDVHDIAHFMFFLFVSVSGR